MNLQTVIPIQEATQKLGYDDKVVFLGSCFAQNIGDKMAYYKFQIRSNPFGILFHPIAIARLIQRVVAKKRFTSKDVFYAHDRWQSFEVHSTLIHKNEQGLLNLLNETLDSFEKQLQESSRVFITLGTAWGYEHIETHSIVANCHKIPQKEFNKVLSSEDELNTILESVIRNILKINPECDIVFTISPVRHIKDGFVENMRSKSHLITALHHLVEAHDVGYFPAYEIMMDELRDYRYYEEDMIHPSSLAIDYIWERFVDTYVTAKAKKTMIQVGDLQKGLAHKPFKPEGAAYKKHIHKMQSKVKELQSSYPHMEF